jgi:hypothetical protein
MPSDFIAWVRSPERTQEELITVERITEAALPLWRTRHQLKVEDYRSANAAEKERIHQRGHNPAYQPVLLDVTLERTDEMLEEMTTLSLSNYTPGHSADRPARVLAPLRWLPRLESLFLGQSELTDPQVLGELKGLRVLHLSDRLLDDLAPVGACRELRVLHLSLPRPWPDLSALAALERLEEFHFHGNLLALEDVPALPQIRVALLSGSGLAPRDLRRLPEMPLLEWLQVRPVFGLAGIERYPRVRALRLGGPMEDLRPLAALHAVTFAELQGHEFRDVAPLATLPEVRWLRFLTERPRDYSSLAAAPRLHEVEVQGCDIHELELGALHAALEPWDSEWALPEPRPRPARPRFFYHTGNDTAPWWPLPDPEGATWNGDGEMEYAERRWFQQQVRQEASRLFGEDFDKAHRRFREYVKREGNVELCQWEHIERLPELIEGLRTLLARTRFRHAIWVTASITAEEALGDDREWEISAESEKEEEELWRKMEREKREQLEREHRFELRKSDGAKIDPEEFAAPPLDDDKVLVPAGAENVQPQQPWVPREHDPEEKPFDPDAWRFDPDLDEWSFAVHFTVLLTEEAMLVQDYHAAAAQHYLKRKAEKLRPAQR